MKLRGPKPSFAVTWILVAALTVAPLMAQDPMPAADPKPVETEHDKASADTPLVEDDDTHSGTPVLAEPLPPGPEPKVPTVDKRSTLKAVPLGSPRGSRADDAPGESKWIITAVLIGAAAVTGIILLLRGWGGGDKSGTVIGAGQPSVNSGLR